MIDPELKGLAELWQEPDAAEAELFERLARKARRRARLIAYGDLAWFLLVGGNIALAAFIRPNVVGASIAVVMLVTFVWLNWKRRSLRQMSRTIDTSDRAAFLESSVRMARGNVRRVTLSLITFPPGLLLAILFRVATKQHGDITHPLGAISAWATSPRGMIALVILTALGGWMMRSRVLLKAELKRIEEVRSAYAEEARRDEADAA
ncbi:MAG TPA: hypothetical protein VGD66_06655 [Allosphingosinicella sp.]|jgi:hypothetical protein